MPQLTDLGKGSGQYSNKGTLESTRRKKIIDALTKRGGVVIPNTGNRFQRTGIPDIFYLEDGVTFFFEVKRDGGDTTATQKLMLERLSEAGAYVGVVHTADEATMLVNRTLNSFAAVLNDLHNRLKADDEDAPATDS